jgi:hypothetical protein
MHSYWIISDSPSSAQISFKFGCTSNTSAMLVLRNAADIHRIKPGLRHLEEGISARCKAWWDYANSKYNLEARRLDLWFVEGLIKTSRSWRTLVWKDAQSEVTATLVGSLPTVANGGFSFSRIKDCSTSPKSQTPKNEETALGSPDSFDQAIFVNLHAIRRNSTSFLQRIKMGSKVKSPTRPSPTNTPVEHHNSGMSSTGPAAQLMSSCRPGSTDGAASDDSESSDSLVDLFSVVLIK